MTHESQDSDVPIIFADEKARIAWVTLQEVRKIAETLPPQTPHARTLAIKFTPEYETKGWYAIMFSGSVLWEGDNGEVLERVPQRTCTILDRLGIPYTVLLKPMRRLL